MKPLVSIIIPAFNAGKWIAESIDSALSQTWEIIEVVVVDDGSEDETVNITSKFRDRRLKIVKQEHHGASASRNNGLMQANGDFIQYLDADDILSTNKIEAQIKLAERFGTEFVFSGAWTRFYKDISQVVFTPQKLWADMNPVEWLVCSWAEDLMMHPAAWLIPRNIAKRAGGWNEKLSLNDDGEYFCRVVLASNGIKFCEDARTYYRSGLASSLSQQQTREAIASWFYSLELSAKHLLAVEDNERTRYACATRFQRFIYDYGPAQPDIQLKAEIKVKELGGSDVLPYGTVLFHILCKTLGWRVAKSIQRLAFRYGFTISL